jgi:hypothetical protein
MRARPDRDGCDRFRQLRFKEQDSLKFARTVIPNRSPQGWELLRATALGTLRAEL